MYIKNISHIYIYASVSEVYVFTNSMLPEILTNIVKDIQFGVPEWIGFGNIKGVLQLW